VLEKTSNMGRKKKKTYRIGKTKICPLLKRESEKKYPRLSKRKRSNAKIKVAGQL